jgi:hypothetical protein
LGALPSVSLSPSVSSSVVIGCALPALRAVLPRSCRAKRRHCCTRLALFSASLLGIEPVPGQQWARVGGNGLAWDGARRAR